MKAPIYKSWIEKFGVTAPIKNILTSVDALEDSYERRLAAMTTEYQQDVEAVVECYKQEKQQFLETTQKQQALINFTKDELLEARRAFERESEDHQVTKDALNNTRNELNVLTEALKNEQELISMAAERIKTAKEQLAVTKKANTIARTKNFFLRILQGPHDAIV